MASSVFGPSKKEKSLMAQQSADIERSRAAGEKSGIASLQSILGNSTDDLLRQYGGRSGANAGMKAPSVSLAGR